LELSRKGAGEMSNDWQDIDIDSAGHQQDLLRRIDDGM
jgi:hypothetical protein